MMLIDRLNICSVLRERKLIFIELSLTKLILIKSYFFNIVVFYVFFKDQIIKKKKKKIRSSGREEQKL